MAENKSGSFHDTGIGLVILLGIGAVLLWLFWYYFHVEVRDAVRWIRYGEMLIISPFMGENAMIDFFGQPMNWREGFAAVPHIPAEELDYEYLTYINALTMQPLKYVFLAMLGGAAAWCLFGGPQTQFRTQLDLDKLIARQALIFPVIKPFVKFNPSKQPFRAPGSPVPAELPLFAEALGPEEFIAYNQIPMPDGKLDEAAAERVFRRQLIARWRGPDALQPHQKILLAAFILKAARKRTQSDTMLGKLAACWGENNRLKIDGNLLKEARAVLRDKKIAGPALAECNKHAFVTTALLRALAYAREEGGVLAPAQFVWLRGHERILWYPLNNLGRQSFHLEALGAMSHYKAERMTERPIPVPKVENAIHTLREYMASIDARPIPPLDYSGSKKRGIKKAA